MLSFLNTSLAFVSRLSALLPSLTPSEFAICLLFNLDRYTDL